MSEEISDLRSSTSQSPREEEEEGSLQRYLAPISAQYNDLPLLMTSMSVSSRGQRVPYHSSPEEEKQLDTDRRHRQDYPIHWGMFYDV